jgi:hypothetical protein
MQVPRLRRRGTATHGTSHIAIQEAVDGWVVT